MAGLRRRGGCDRHPDGAVRGRWLLDRNSVARRPWGTGAPRRCLATARDHPCRPRCSRTLRPRRGGQAASGCVDARRRVACRRGRGLAVGTGRRSDPAHRLRTRPDRRRTAGTPPDRAVHSFGGHRPAQEPPPAGCGVRRRWAVHRTARQRRRLLARADVPVGLRTSDARSGRHEPVGHRRTGRPDARHALGARPHRLDRGRRLRHRRDTDQHRERSVGAASHRTRLRHAFGWFLIGSGVAFVVYRVLAATG